MTAATDKDSRLSFNAGASTGTLTLDNVKLKKIAEPDPGTISLAPALHLKTASGKYNVYNLAGRRLGFIVIIENDVPSMSKAMKTAGYGKGVYILRNKNRSFMIPVDR